MGYRYQRLLCALGRHRKYRVVSDEDYREHIGWVCLHCFGEWDA